MGLQCRSHRKISTACVLIILMSTFGIKAILATSSSSSSSSSTTSIITSKSESAPVAAVVESIEEIETDSGKLDLDKAETSKDSQKIEIIKQIQKLNNDGSYTVGYEAEDGTFKIESRDVLGNVKGTYGYVDSNGEIKRISYTANNGTGLKNGPLAAEESVHIPRYNRSLGTPTTRRPSYSSSTTASTTRATVIQSIPKRLRIIPASPTERSNYREYTSSTPRTTKPDATTTVVYATSVPTPKPYINIRPTPLPGSNIRPVEQIARPEKLEINHVSKVQLLPNKDMSTIKPVVEEIDEKEEEKKFVRGNSLRRQLMPESDDKYDARSVLYSHNQGGNDELGHIYGPSGSTSRPLYTTTSNPRIPALVLAARNRAAQIQNSFITNQQTAAEKYYVKSSPSRKQELDENEQTTESTSEQAYLTQNPIPVQIPANRASAQEEDRRSVRRPIQNDNGRYRQSQYVRVQQQTGQVQDSPRIIRIPIPQNQQVDDHDQYLRETTSPTSQGKNEQLAEQEPVPARIPQGYYRNAPQYYTYPQDQAASYYPPPVPTPAPNPYAYSYRPVPVNPPYYDLPERPLTTRDFERLLQILILRHQQLQRLGYPGGIPYPGYTNPYPYPGYTPYTRPSIFNPYDGRFPYRQPIPGYPEPENMYQAQNPIVATETPMSYELQRLIPRKKQYSPRYFGAQAGTYNMDDYPSATTTLPGPGHPNYLPPEVREELLYRMLMLALQTEPQPAVIASPAQTQQQSNGQVPSDSDASTTTKSPIIYKKPIRSVQILGEEP